MFQVETTMQRFVLIFAFLLWAALGAAPAVRAVPAYTISVTDIDIGGTGSAAYDVSDAGLAGGQILSVDGYAGYSGGTDYSEPIAVTACRTDRCHAVRPDSAAAVPEPAALLVLGAGLLVMTLGRVAGRAPPWRDDPLVQHRRQ